MRKSMFFALVIAGAFGCDRNRDQSTMHEARTQNTPTQQAAQNEGVDMDNPNNRTLPDDTDQQGTQGTQQGPGGSDVGNPNDPSGSSPTNPPTGPTTPTDPNDDLDDDLPPTTGPDVP